MSANSLEGVPVTIGAMGCLKVLELYNNRLRALPVELGEIMTNLDRLTLSRNPLNYLPPKWCDNWGNKEKYMTLWSGYTDGQVCDWVVDHLTWYVGLNIYILFSVAIF